MAAAAPADARLARRLVLDELIPVETRHHAFWQSFFGLELGRLDPRATAALPSVLTAGTVIVVVSALLAFLAGMDVRRRVVMNVLITALAVLATYAIGLAAKALFGVTV